MAKRYIGNRELINDISNCNPLAEVFILEAIAFYSNMVSNMADEEFGKNPIIHPDLWKDIAEEALNRIEHRNEG